MQHWIADRIFKTEKLHVAYSKLFPLDINSKEFEINL